MNIATLIVLIIVVMLAALAVRRIKKRRLLFSCGGDCASCAQGCRRQKDLNSSQS